MKHLTLLMACMFILLCALPAQAQIPRLISFQGILTDTNGQPVADGSHDVAFALYENRTTTTPLWRETQSVEVVDGLFNVLLGSAAALTIEFDAPYYLGIAVDGDPELQPRTQLAAAPYAMRAVAADRAADADHAARADQADVSSALAPDATGAVTSLNQLTGDIEMVGVGGTSVSTNGGTITITSSGGGGGIVSLHNTDGSISILNPTGPAVTLGLVDGGVIEQKIANLAVTTAKLGNLAVTGSKLADNAVTTTKIAPEAVTTSRISSVGATAGEVLAYDGSAVGWTQLTSGGVNGSGATGLIALWDGTSRLKGSSHFVFDGIRMGIGLSSPEATLHVDGENGLLVTGIFAGGMVMNHGAGTRMHWYPRAAAFRAGHVTSSQWDANNIGLYSAAMGFGTVASERYCFAMGESAEASNVAAAAFGCRTKATGKWSMALGHSTIASGDLSLAMGSETTASGRCAIASGIQTTASGDHALTLGHQTTAAGNRSIAAGSLTVADGTASCALGTQSAASGENAVAIGSQTQANGRNSFAAGNTCIASGVESLAFGSESTADANYAVAIGLKTTASGYVSTALGFVTKANGMYATACGSRSVAAGEASTAIGIKTSAGGTGAIALGCNTTASGDYSTAMGSYARTAGNAGSFAIGDNSSTSQVSASAPNQMIMRFAGGYRLYTSSNLSTWAYLPPAGTGWSTPSDRRMKENFRDIDGEVLLEKIRQLPVSEWNYIDADPSVRYIGPMAQDFWQAFRLCGTDSLTINSVAMDGVNLAAIKALERRTRELRAATERIAELEARIDVLEQREVSASGTSQTVSRTSGTSVPAADVQVFLSRIAELEARLDDIVQEQ